jgi:tetratricopeptide (TPR) repeat protein
LEIRRVHKMRRSLRKEAYFALGVFIFAFAIRFIYLTQMKSSPLFDAPTMDAEYHDQWAQTLLGGEDFTDGVFFRAPLYPYFLAASYSIFGHSYLMVRLLQFLIGSLSCVLVYLLGRKLFNQRTAVIAAILASVNGVLIYFEGELLIPVLLVFLDTLLILALFWTGEKPSYRRWALCGALLGLSALARPNILLVGVAFWLWIILRFRGEAKARTKSLAYAGYFALGAILIIAPVTLRNYVKGGDFVLIASQGGMNFYIGNNPQSDGASAVLPGARTTWWGSYQDAKNVAEQASGRSLKPSEVSRFWYIEGLKFMTNKPLNSFKLMARKFALFWNGNELSNNRDFYFFARSAPLLKLLIWRFVIYFPFGLIAPLALVGIILSHREKRNVLILELFLFVYMLSVILFFVTARYRVPAIPVLVLFSAYAVDRLAYMIRRRETVEWGKYLLILLIILIPINIQMPGYSSANPGQAHYSLGVLYSKKGNKARAKEEFNKALRYNPNLAEAAVNLGSIYGDEGKHKLALEYYRKALQIGADSAFVLYNIGIEYHNQGLMDQAQTNYELSLSIREDNPRAHYLLGEIYLQRAMVEDAMAEYQNALRYDPEYALAYYRLGSIYQQLGQNQDAITNLENFVRLWKGEPERIENVTKLLEELKEKGGE